MKYEYFISSRWRNRDSVVELTNKIRGKGKVVYSFLEDKQDSFASVDDDPEKVMSEYESNANWQKDPNVKFLFDKDLNALKESEILLMLLPVGKSCHIEAGIAYGMGKRCILIGEQKEAESLYLIFSEFFPDIDSFIESL